MINNFLQISVLNMFYEYVLNIFQIKLKHFMYDAEYILKLNKQFYVSQTYF